MEPQGDTSMPWTEVDSENFIGLGQIVTPDRDELRDLIVSLLPADPNDEFQVVELAVGDGWLAQAILERFEGARVLGLDGSPTMLRTAAERLRHFGPRFLSRQFRLEDPSWLARIGGSVRCFVSSLTIHHLDGRGKRVLYRALRQHLEEPGAVLIADLVAPTSPWEREYMTRAWYETVRRQSLAYTGSLDAYTAFVGGENNIYEYPDPMDMPSTIPEHLAWLREAGFADPTVFWARAAHALYGGYI